jgi:hypothetical protein
MRFNKSVFKLLIPLLLGCFISNTGYAEIYMWLDENGNKVYSDNPDEKKQAQPVELTPLTILGFPEQDKSPDTTATRPLNPFDQMIDYKSIVISSPQNDATVRDNSGTVEVQILTEPALAKGYTVEIWLDNVSTGAPKANTSFVLTNVDRGTHTLSAKLYDPQGKPLLTSPAITFHMHRFTAKTK